MIFPLLALCLSVQSAVPDSSASVVEVPSPASKGMRPYVGGELGMASIDDRDEKIRGFLDMGFYGESNSLGLLLAFQDDRINSVTESKTGNQPPVKTNEYWEDFELLTLGFDYRHYFRAIGDPLHAPFVSATVARSFYLYMNNGVGSEPDVARTALGLALGEEVRVGALFLSGKVGARCHLMVDRVESADTTRKITYSSRDGHVVTSLDVTLGMAYRF